jgi:GTP-binding protein
MSSPLQLRFLTSADDVSRLPDTPAEIAFIGRSNVGKSSLVNALGNRKDLARVAKAPGRTQLLNCFEVEGLGTLVDCPGFGYASAPVKVREGWQRMVETYLLEREQLTMVVLLVDGEIGPTKLYLEMLSWLRVNGVPHSVVATKHDKVRAAHRDKRKREVAAACNLEPGDITWVSAAKGTGKDRLLSLARTWLSLG